MGWDFTHQATKKDIINQLIARKQSGHKHWNTVDFSVRGNILWMLEEYTDTDAMTNERYIVCALLKSQRGYGWGYKDMTEAMEPFYYNCPLKFLDRAPVTCQEWRNKVRMYHAQQAHKKDVLRILEVGDKLILKGSTIPHVIVSSLKPLRGTYQNKAYHIPPRFIFGVGPGDLT